MTEAPARTTLMLADDDGLILATLGKELRDAGYDVIECHDGDEVISACDARPPDLAILDIAMPRTSGIETARALREKKIPVVFLTAHSDADTVQGAVEEGALGYVVKPTDINRMLPTIKSALMRARDMRALEEESARMAENLETGRLINVAVGIVMERFRLGREESFNLMRNKARSERRKLATVALEVTTTVDALNKLSMSAHALK